MLKVALYIRVSSQEQVEGYSLGEQEERLRNYCKAMGWGIHKLYADPGYSGGSTDRPGLQTMIKDIKAGLIDKVVVYKLDRLSRSQLDTLYLIEKVFLVNNCDFVSMSENFDTATPFGRAMIGILAVFAQLERERIKERTLMGKEARAKEGKWQGGSTPPIGYDYDVPTQELVVNEYEAMQLREAAELFLSGTPLRTIENIFAEKGYTHKHGSTWDPKTMRRLFRSKIYLGYIRYKNVWYKGTHEPIFTEKTHNQLIKLLDDRAERYKQSGVKPGAHTTLLGGLLTCKHCGGKYAKQRQNKPLKDGTLTYHYMCYSRSKKSKKMIKDPACRNKNWKVEELDKIIIDEIRKIKLDPDAFIEAAQSDSMDKTDTGDKIKIIEKEIAKIDDQISRFMDLYGIGKFTIEQVSQKVDPLNEDKTKLEKELNNLKLSVGELSAEETIEIIESFDDVIDLGTFDEQRFIIERLISYIELDGEDIYIHWNFA